jgi:hypothetical protein
MARLRCVRWASVGVTVTFFLFLAACGKSKPPGASPFPAKINLNPATSASMPLGSTMAFTANAQNGSNSSVSPAFTYASSSPAIVNISPTGLACAGTWNAPYYNVCTPGGEGTAEITASALGATSPPTLVFVHPAIDNIQISVVPPVNSPPPACPGQTALPAACGITFNANAANYCLSQNQVETLQATAYSQGVDITASVGPFTWNQSNLNVVTVTPIITSSTNVATNQATVVSSTPGETQVVASASGFSSLPYSAETCPVQCITLSLGQNGSHNIDQTSFTVSKGTSETITATAVDVQGCMVPKPPLTWTSTSPAALTVGGATTGCSGGATCTISTTQPGAAAITASCTPPTCNLGFPLNSLNVPGLPQFYFPQPIYPVTSISGLVTGTTTAASVLATSQDCYANALCPVALYDISTSTNVAASPSQLPTPPNSLMFDTAGDKAYVGSQFGAVLITSANLGSSTTSPFTLLGAAGTPLGLVTGKVIGVSPNGSLAVFSDTISTPNQVYVVNTGGAGATTTPLTINSATTATFSPDNSKAFILGNSGNTLYVYSPLQALQSYALTAPADAVAFSSSGAFAFIAGGDSASNITVRNTCDNSLAGLPPPGVGNFSITGLPATPLFLKLVPPGNAPTGNSLIPSLQQPGLDVFFGIDNTGIDVIATTSTAPLTPLPATTALCPQQQIGLATLNQTTTTFAPIHINLQKGTFHPINVFLSPDSTQVYIVTSDLGVLVYNFSTQSVSAIPLIGTGNPAPVAADITVDGALLYVAGTDGILHELNTATGVDQMEIPFFQLPDSSNNFCYSSYDCTLNLVAIKP